MGWPKEAYLYLRQIVKPVSRPQKGGNYLYTKSDNNLYLLDADGTEHTVGGAGSALTVQDENANVSTSVTQIDFQGAGVTATAGTGEVIVTIPTPTFTETLPASIIDAKGDLIVGTANDTAARLAVGTNATSLVADSTQAGGVKWENRVKSLVASTGMSIDSTDPLNPVLRSVAGPGSFAGIILPTAGTTFQPPYNSTATTTATLGAGILRMYAFPLSSPMTVVSMIASVSATAGGASTVRLGVYDSDPVTYSPRNLVISAGTVSNPSTGNQTATLGTPVTLQPGFYWMAHLPDVIGGTWTAMATGMTIPILGANTRLDATGVAAGGLPSVAPAMTPAVSGTAGLKTWVST